MSDKTIMKREIRCISQYNSILITRYIIFAGLILGSIWFSPVTFYILAFYLIVPYILKASLADKPSTGKTKTQSSSHNPPMLSTLYEKYHYDGAMHQYQSLATSFTGFFLLIWGIYIGWPQRLYPLMLLAGSLLLKQCIYWFYRIRIHIMLVNNSL